MSKGKKRSGARPGRPQPLRGTKGKRKGARLWYVGGQQRSEERFSRNAETDLVCRLLLEKKKLTELKTEDASSDTAQLQSTSRNPTPRRRQIDDRASTRI